MPPSGPWTRTALRTPRFVTEPHAVHSAFRAHCTPRSLHIARAQVREAVRRSCGINGGVRAAGRARTTVRLLQRPPGTSRQLEDRELLVAAWGAPARQQLGSLRVRDGGASSSARSPRVASERDHDDVVVEESVADVSAHPPSNASSTSLASFLCEQVRWFAHANVVLVAHGAQTTNAIWADAHALIVDLLPYAHKHEPSAPSDYYAALLHNTDVEYRMLRTQRPTRAPALKGAHGGGGGAAAGGSRAPSAGSAAASARRFMPSAAQEEAGGLTSEALASRCREDKVCRVAYRDGGDIRIGEAGLRELRALVRQHVANRTASSSTSSSATSGAHGGARVATRDGGGSNVRRQRRGDSSSAGGA